MKRHRYVFDIETVPLAAAELTDFAPTEDEIKVAHLKDPNSLSGLHLTTCHQ